jgi:hypothetical protein
MTVRQAYSSYYLTPGYPRDGLSLIHEDPPCTNQAVVVGEGGKEKAASVLDNGNHVHKSSQDRWLSR